MTFLELAETVLRSVEKPLTANEIWELAKEQDLVGDLNSRGKTPWATMAAQLYVNCRDQPDSVFKTIGKRPKRFFIAKKKYSIDFSEFESGVTEEEEQVSTPDPTPHYLEKDLHPYLARFAYYSLNCHCKTINHSTSDKKSFGEWVHPDMVGCVFPIEEWDDEVLELSASMGNTSVQFISFELKKELNLSTLREKFFQTVSNSSWANESYLVAAKISRDPDFHNELKRLSAAFGIGVIQLEIEEPNSAEIIYPAKSRDSLDWDTINKLIGMNKDFKEFVKRVRIDLKSNEIRKEKYDKILNEDQLLKMITSR
ncbi:MAG TPA: hypothetical protein DCE41_08900 [Cytophagales bacterium]|nr:hypothetical protein [Cytophagales bacterium]HAP61984.1 hypothetical protein [Cytophagales bacterium]